MRKYRFILACLSVLLAVAFLAGCAGMTAKPTDANFKEPTVTLNRVEVPYYTGYWYFSSKVEPTKGTAGNYGAPMGLAFVFDITNPNDYPVMMESLKFSIAFEDFELNTVSADDPMWIPAGKTNQLRVNAIMDARSSLLSLLVTGGFKLKEKGMSPWDALEKWWTGAPEMSFPIHVQQGSAIFKADGVVKGVQVSATYP
ncbi:MAG: hypothetical protein PVG78_14135 [Desulfobacterales bacterium]|jgi:hypothetical protein